MNNIDLANALVFHGLGIQKETFDDRLIAQKKIYLLQMLGIDLGYHYKWYLHGPYAPSLTSYMYANLDWIQKSEEVFASYKLSAKAKDCVRRVNELAKHSMKADLGEAAWYELLASLHYIYQNNKSWEVKGTDDVFEKLRQYKPQYSQEQCQVAFNVLEQEGFCG